MQRYKLKQKLQYQIPGQARNEGFLFESAEIATFTPQEKTKLENDMRTERDFKNQMAYAEEKAREEGREGALHQVEHQLRERGMSEADIAALVQSVREATII